MTELSESQRTEKILIIRQVETRNRNPLHAQFGTTLTFCQEMELGNIVSVPCLSDAIDQLEDQGLITCDFDFGMLTGKTTPVFTKASPSHESDSGVSDMVDLESNLRSVSPNSDTGLSEVGSNSNDLFDFDSLTGQFLEDELDAEIASYFKDPSVSDKIHLDVNLGKNDSDAKKPEFVARAVRKESSETDVDIESDSSDQENASVERRILRPKRHVKFNDSADVHILPSTSKDMPEITTKPAVKVVKVIKTPANTSNAALDNKILEAIDDRSRKNAIQAKMNREKKKAYIKSLEDEIESLKMENFAVRNSNKKVMKERDALLEEREYLKSVIANQSTLSGLLQNIGKVDNVKLTSSFAQRKRSAELDHDYDSSGKRVKKTKTTAGVCLHVDDGNVSIEFCSKCATAAKSTADEES